MPPHIVLRHSKLFSALIAFILVISCISIWLTPIGLLWRLLLSLVVVVYTGQVLWKDAMLLSPKSITRLTCYDSSWLIQDKTQPLRGQLCGDSCIMPFACVLRFKIHGAKYWRSTRTVVVFPDAVDSQTYRRLNQHLNLLRLNYAAHS